MFYCSSAGSSLVVMLGYTQENFNLTLSFGHIRERRGVGGYFLPIRQPHSSCPLPFAKAGDIKTHSSVRLSVRLSVSPSVTKTLTWLISSEVLMIEHWYLACMILVTSPFYWYHVVTLTLIFDLLQGQICCRVGDHNSSNLLVFIPFKHILVGI